MQREKPPRGGFFFVRLIARPRPPPAARRRVPSVFVEFVPAVHDISVDTDSMDKTLLTFPLL
jgi:hypothetical protein